MTQAELQTLLDDAVRLHQNGNLAEAEVFYRRVLAQAPRHPEALHRLGMLAHQVGQHTTAAELIGLALREAPRHPGLHSDLGTVLQSMGRYGEAAICYRNVLALRPSPAAHNNLGLALYSMGRPEEAIAHYREALALRPELAPAWNNLGLACINLGRLDEACYALRRALDIEPGYPEAHNNIGMACHELGDADAAMNSYCKAITLRPGYYEAYNNLGNVLLCSLNRPHDALGCFRQALAIRPDYALAYDNMLQTSNYLPDMPAETVYALHQGYAERFEAPHRTHWTAHDNDRNPDRRLKVGYVSPDFRLHPVAFFMEPVLAHHDKRRVEVHCYYNQSLRDEVTVRLEAHADHWIECGGMSDADLAARIRADGIDVLVDLAGHTAGNRLGVFVRKPAPVQVTYLGYVATTGLGAMDYRLSHADADPPGNEHWNSEHLYRMPRGLWCWRPPANAPEVQTTTPLRTNGHVTFGSLNNIAKITDVTVALWARLLHAVPGSRLLIAGVPADTPQRITRERFAAHDIDAARLELVPKIPGIEFRALMHRIDIALDPFPHNGNTTTCEALWMGVPVVTLIGRDFVSRFGHLLLRTVGLEDLAAGNEDEYVRIAAGLARDPAGLDRLRAGMRARMETSSLRDETGIARDIETAYREMWQTWCRAGALPAAVSEARR